MRSGPFAFEHSRSVIGTANLASDLASNLASILRAMKKPAGVTGGLLIFD
jgi:hypothetical protein